MLAESSAFHTAIFDALCACLNLSAAEGVKLIHEAYAEPENAPRPARNKNVIYWTVLQDLSADPVSTVYDPEGGAGRNTPVVDPPQPSLLHEEEGSLWRKRADLTISLRVRDEQRAQNRGSINSTPAVIIH